MNSFISILNIVLLTLFSISCKDSNEKEIHTSSIQTKNVEVLPIKNQQIICSVQTYGPSISSTYEQAVCTELLIQILEKVQPLTAIDKKRIRIITKENIQDLLHQGSKIPQGVAYALTENDLGIPINAIKDVLPGDLVQFWTNTWGHCGIVKSIDSKHHTMDLYSSFPSTKGYGIQTFAITQHTFFVRLK